MRLQAVNKNARLFPLRPLTRKDLRELIRSPLISRKPTVNLRRVIISVYLLLFLAVGAASGVYFLDAREEYNRLRQQEEISRRRLAEAEAKLKEQEKILERLRNDPVYVEKVIRRRLGYARPEEFIFRFED